eukprot:TRINITY_DN27663_c0_g2_i1.p1 TRINITY_DN27663_c0_g2~~TRINITY_DN27663_c0_g2_i1.p1  ORF type:complete len:192 (-),score=30.92 TRINITY_DN27663_c0_g2_i1:182-757(-)
MTCTARRDEADLSALETRFRNEIARDPHDISAYILLGHVLAKKGDSIAAEEVYRVGLGNECSWFASDNGDSVPSSAGVASVRSCSTQDMNETTFRKKRQRAAAHNNLGVLHQERGDLDGAERCFRAAIHCCPLHLPSRKNLAGILELRGDSDAAEAAHADVFSVESAVGVVVGYGGIRKQPVRGRECAKPY